MVKEGRRPLRMPWGLLGMLVLAGTFEVALARRAEALRSNDGQCWAITAELAEREALGAEVLCFGDSLMKFGIYPRVFESRTGRPMRNLAVNRGPAPVTYFLLRRALAAGARPSAVLVDSATFSLVRGPSTTLPPGDYPFADLLTLAETFELCWSARDPWLFARIVTRKALPSVNVRLSIRDDIVGALAGAIPPRRGNNAALRRNLAINGGAQVNADWVVSVKDPDPPPIVAHEGTFAADPVNRHYLERTFALLKQHRIAAYWLILPVHPHEHAIEHYEGNALRLTRFVAWVVARHPEVSVVDGRGSGFGRDLYLDMGHLNYRGAVACTSALAEWFQRPSREPWSTLPAPRPAPAMERLEDINRSREIARRDRESLDR